MTREEHKAAVQSIMAMIAPEHQAAASEALTNLSNDYEQTLTQHETAQSDVQRLTSDNEALRSANMQLFLKVGNTNPTVTNPTTPEPKDEEPLPFADLFDENGGLK